MKKEKLPDKRPCLTREVKIGGDTVILSVGEYSDGRLGEVFMDVDHMGSSFSAMTKCFCILLSKALQYGMPFEEIASTFIRVRFEPAGSVVGHDHLTLCSSIIDYMFKDLSIEYLGNTDLIQKGKTIEKGKELQEDLPEDTQDKSSVDGEHPTDKG